MLIKNKASKERFLLPHSSSPLWQGRQQGHEVTSHILSPVWKKRTMNACGLSHFILLIQSRNTMPIPSPKTNNDQFIPVRLLISPLCFSVVTGVGMVPRCCYAFRITWGIFRNTDAQAVLTLSVELGYWHGTVMGPCRVSL